MNAAPSSGVEQTPASWPHARNRRARRREQSANEAIVFPTTYAGWARSTRKMRQAFWDRYGMQPPEIHTAREAAMVIEKRRTEARDRGEEFELHISAEDLARAHEVRQRTTPWLAEPIIFPIIERASRLELGYCNATEYTLRGWAWVDTGHPFGEQTIGRFLRDAHDAGRLERQRIPRGGHFKNGAQTIGGTTTNRLWSKKERDAARWKETLAKRAYRKQRARAERTIQREPSAPETPARAPRVDEPRTALPEVMSDFVLPKDFLSAPPAEPNGVPMAAEDWEAKRARENKRLADWIAANGDKPPD